MMLAGGPVVPGLRAREMSVARALEWAFREECARLEFDEMGETAGSLRVGVDGIWLMMQRGALGCEIDGGGRSHPAWDAEVIASTLAALPSVHGGRSMAVRMASLARAGMAPDWMQGARPRLVPEGWRNSRHGLFARTAVYGSVEYLHRGRKVRRDVLGCPVRYVPTAAQIAAARRDYLDWWGALWWVRCELRTLGILRKVRITDAMPPMEPWRQAAEAS